MLLKFPDFLFSKFYTNIAKEKKSRNEKKKKKTQQKTEALPKEDSTTSLKTLKDTKMLSEKVAQRKTLLFLSCGQFPCHTSRPLKTKLLSCLKEGRGWGEANRKTEISELPSHQTSNI